MSRIILTCCPRCLEDSCKIVGRRGASLVECSSESAVCYRGSRFTTKAAAARDHNCNWNVHARASEVLTGIGLAHAAREVAPLLAWEDEGGARLPAPPSHTEFWDKGIPF